MYINLIRYTIFSSRLYIGLKKLCLIELKLLLPGIKIAQQ